MGEVQDLQLQIRATEESNRITGATQPSKEATSINKLLTPIYRRYKWWLLVALYSFLIVAGNTTGNLLGRLYFDNGAKSKWMATFVETAGFPFLIPFLIFSSPAKRTISLVTLDRSPSIATLIVLYVSFGLLSSGNNLMYSYGLAYLPVSTYSLLCSSQLVFSALFSYLLNSIKLTPYIVNSVVLLTISGVLLALSSESSPSSSTGKYVIGFFCTIGASALFSLLLSLTQLTFEKILHKESMSTILKMLIFPTGVTTCVCVVGIFASGEWRELKGEMEGYKSGKVSYIMNLVWTAISWTVYSIGNLGLILEASSLFTNVINTISLPVIPIFAVFLFHDKMDAVKVVSMLLSVWGFCSYVYQHYLEGSKPEIVVRSANEICDTSSDC